MNEPLRPRLLAVIREGECIGCGKCLPACPVDAILGSAKQMHTVIADECIGCKLCLPPCPVDCIDLVVSDENKLELDSSEIRKERAARIKKRYTARKKRLGRESDTLELASLLESDEKKEYIREAVERVKMRKKAFTFLNAIDDRGNHERNS